MRLLWNFCSTLWSLSTLPSSFKLHDGVFWTLHYFAVDAFLWYFPTGVPSSLDLCILDQQDRLVPFSPGLLRVTKGHHFKSVFGEVTYLLGHKWQQRALFKEEEKHALGGAVGLKWPDKASWWICWGWNSLDCNTQPIRLTASFYYQVCCTPFTSPGWKAEII